MTQATVSPLALALVCELATVADGQGMSLPRLGKRLGQGVSVLMRELAIMGNASIGGTAGPGWVRLEQDDGRWVAFLSAEGRQVAEALQAAMEQGHTEGARP